MIVKTFIEGLKSVMLKSLTAPPESRRSAPLSMVFIGVLGGVSLILMEVFLGLSLCKTLRLDYGYSEGLSMLVAALIYLLQALLSILLVNRSLKKMSTENVMVREYQLVKSVVSALVDGYRSK